MFNFLTKQVFRSVLGIVFCASIVASAKTTTFTILTFNDVYEIVPDSHGRGGFAEMAALLNQERAKVEHHITTVNGDFLSPCLLSIFDRGAHRIELFHMMGVDFVVLGNHEFDFGPSVVKKRIEESRFPWLAANAIGISGTPFTGDKQTVIIDVDGIKVGIFGLITVDTPSLSSVENQVDFSPIAYTARHVIKELKDQGAEVIVALTHLVMKDDLKLAEEVPEINVILGGHDHEPMTWFNGKTFVHKSGFNAQYLTRLDLELEKDESSGKVFVFPTWNVLINKDIPRDELVGGKVDELQAMLESVTGEPIGVMQMYCDSYNNNVRSKETKIGNLIADALRVVTGADVSFITGGVIRGNKSYKPGSVLTFKNILEELPFGNVNVVVEVPGKVILEALENGVSQAGARVGRFPQVSGMKFTYDPEKSPGARIEEVVIQGEPLDLSKMYKVATVDYIFNGGDSYEMFKGGKILLSPLQLVSLVGTVSEYIKTMDRVETFLEQRIVAKEHF